MVQCNSTLRARQIGNVYDATHSRGVAQNSRLTKRGLMRFSDTVQGTSLALQSANASNTSVRKLWINAPATFTQQTSMPINCAFNRTPELFATAAAFGRVGHYAVVIEHSCNVPQVLPQLVVRKLIGFRGDY